MLFDDHKKAITTIIGKRNQKGERTHEPTPMKMESVKTEDGMPDGRHMAMQEFMAAHHEGSPEKMMNAMSNFIDLHHSMQGGDSPGSEAE
jgi:hypothetical protein